MTDSVKDTALGLARVLLKAESEKGLLTPEIIRANVEKVTLMLGAPSNAVEQLVTELQTLFHVWIGDARVLEDAGDHIPWLATRRGELEWKFWRRYMQYLEEDMKLAPRIITRLDSLTDAVLERFEDPIRKEKWDRRGMVVGHVQSGKTANYTGLICKALDAGYKLVVVLAGIHNSLRSQTQLRLDEGILGFDTRDRMTYDESNKGIGVGRVGERLIANSFTHSGENGDFNAKVASQAAVMFGGADPFILVVKKNASVLRNLIKWAIGLRGEKDEKNEDKIKGVPLLVVDDEADNASIDVKKKAGQTNDTVSTINGLIRQLLNVFEQSAYVAYTATPFANIFIDPGAMNPLVGEDLFPRDFIINLPTPSNYVGPARVFGLSQDLAAGIDAQEGLPIVRTVDDQEAWMPVKHKADHVPMFLPPSLKEAIGAFVLSSALRLLRGQEDKHNSMLIHVTRYVTVQAEVKELVEQEVAAMRRRLEFGEGSKKDSLLASLHALWERDFLPTSKAMGTETDLWEDVEPLLFKAMARMQVRTINGSAADILDYRDYKKGLSVIAVGGDKLSRGLTLEGLTVSYYLRATKMYDTLMQMGRWFGYRPGYLDVCRLYTSSELQEWYRHISLASEELRKEFDFMVGTGRTPMDFGLRVRTHPDALMITAANKMRSGTRLQLSFAADISESVVFHLDRQLRGQNFQTLERFIHAISSTHGQEQVSHWKMGTRQWTWSGVAAEQVVDFLSEFVSHEDSRKANAKYLGSYVKKMQHVQELTSWTIVLVSSAKSDRFVKVAGCDVGTVMRKCESSDGKRYSIGRLVSPRDECLDLDPGEFQQALARTVEVAKRCDSLEAPGFPSGKAMRLVRPSTRALFLVYLVNVPLGDPLVGIAISFPDSKNAQTIEYVVNNPYFEQEYLEV